MGEETAFVLLCAAPGGDATGECARRQSHRGGDDSRYTSRPERSPDSYNRVHNGPLSVRFSYSLTVRQAAGIVGRTPGKSSRFPLGSEN